MAFVCQFCTFRCSNWRTVLRHTFEAHFGPNVRFTCGIDNCPQTFATFSAATSHWARKHKGRDFGIQSTTPEVSTCGENPQVLLGSDHDEDPPDVLDTGPGVQSEHLSRKSAGLFLLTLKERYQLTQTAMNFAVGQVKEMVAFLSEDLRSAVEATVQQHCAAAGVVPPDLGSCFEDVDPFCGLETEYMQTKFYREKFGLVVSRCVITPPCSSTVTHLLLMYSAGTSLSGVRNPIYHNLRWCFDITTSGGALAQRKGTFQYVPLLMAYRRSYAIQKYVMR